MGVAVAADGATALLGVGREPPLPHGVADEGGRRVPGGVADVAVPADGARGAGPRARAGAPTVAVAPRPPEVAVSRGVPRLCAGGAPLHIVTEVPLVIATVGGAGAPLRPARLLGEGAAMAVPVADAPLVRRAPPLHVPRLDGVVAVAVRGVVEARGRIGEEAALPLPPPETGARLRGGRPPATP